jgi:hypothetical protein
VQTGYGESQCHRTLRSFLIFAKLVLRGASDEVLSDAVLLF